MMADEEFNSLTSDEKYERGYNEQGYDEHGYHYSHDFDLCSICQEGEISIDVPLVPGAESRGICAECYSGGK